MTQDEPTRRRKALAWLAPLFAAAICAAAVSLFLGQNRNRDPAPASAQAARLADLEQQLQRSNVALRRLEQLQLMQAAAASEPSARPATSAEQVDAEGPAAPEAVEDGQQAPYPEQREKAFFNAYFSELEVAMSQQRSDRQLAAQLTPLVPGVAEGLVRVVDLTCTQALCRLEARYEHADRESRDRFIRDLQTAFAPVMTRASIHLPTDEKRLLGYFAKKGATLPRPTTSFATFMRGDEGQ